MGGGGEGKGGAPGGASFPQIERANNRYRAKSSSQEVPTASGTRVGLDRDSGWGQRGFAATAKGPAPEPPQQMRLHTRRCRYRHMPGLLRASTCPARSCHAHVHKYTYLDSHRQMLHGNRLGDEDTKIPVADTPVQQRHTGDPAHLGRAGKHPSVHVFLSVVRSPVRVL